MNVSVTRKEIDYQAALLKSLREWENLSQFHELYSRGGVSLSVDGNCGRGRVDVDLDVIGPVHPGGPKQQLDFDIAVIMRAAMQEAFRAVVARIKQEMPIQLSD